MHHIRLSSYLIDTKVVSSSTLAPSCDAGIGGTNHPSGASKFRIRSDRLLRYRGPNASTTPLGQRCQPAAKPFERGGQPPLGQLSARWKTFGWPDLRKKN